MLYERSTKSTSKQTRTTAISAGFNFNMKYYSFRSTLVIATTYIFMAIQPASAQSSVPAAEIGRCAALSDSLKRLACYDTLGLRVTKSKDGGKAIRESQAEEAKQLLVQTQDRERTAELQRIAAAEDAKASAELAKKEQIRKTGLASAVKATSALQAIKKLQVRVEAGVSYRDYPAVLADAKYAFGEFAESEAARTLNEAEQLMRVSISHYERAAEVWRTKFSGRGGVSEIFSRFENTRLYDEILSIYGSRMRTEAQVSDGLLYAGALPVIWSAARASTMKADESIRLYVGTLTAER